MIAMKFVQETLFPVRAAEVFAFHERADAFALLQPPWDRVEIITPPSSLEVGTRVELKTKVGPFWIHIIAQHVAYEKNRRFEDVMVKGPFAKWHHQHIFLEQGEGCLLRDEIDYAPPMGWLGRLVDPIAIRPKLTRLFAYRHEVTLREVLAAREARDAGR